MIHSHSPLKLWLHPSFRRKKMLAYLHSGLPSLKLRQVIIKSLKPSYVWLSFCDPVYGDRRDWLLSPDECQETVQPAELKTEWCWPEHPYIMFSSCIAFTAPSGTVYLCATHLIVQLTVLGLLMIAALSSGAYDESKTQWGGSKETVLFIFGGMWFVTNSFNDFDTKNCCLNFEEHFIIFDTLSQNQRWSFTISILGRKYWGCSGGYIFPSAIILLPKYFQKKSSMELAWFAPGVIKAQQYQTKMEHKFEHSWKIANFFASNSPKSQIPHWQIVLHMEEIYKLNMKIILYCLHGEVTLHILLVDDTHSASSLTGTRRKSPKITFVHWSREPWTTDANVHVEK